MVKRKSVSLLFCHTVYTCLFRSSLPVFARLQSRSLLKTGHQSNSTPLEKLRLNLLKIKIILLYVINQTVPRCKHFPPRL